jgi:hypothetical protein
LAESTHKTYDNGVKRFRDFCEHHHFDEVADEETVTLWVADLSTHGTATSTINTYMSALKKALSQGRIRGDPTDPDALSHSELLKDIIKGHERTFVPPEVLRRSISAPFTHDDFADLVKRYRSDVADSLFPDNPAQRYDMVLAGMALGLGGCMRPGEYLRTSSTQRPEAILHIQQIRFRLHGHGKDIPATELQEHLQRGSPIGPNLHITCVAVTLHCDKTDQTKKGREIGISNPLCINLIASYLLTRPSKDKEGRPLTPFLIDVVDGIPQHCPLYRFTPYMRALMTRHGDKLHADDYSAKSLRSGAAESITMGQARAIAQRVKDTGRWSNLKTPTNHYCGRRRSSSSK